MVVELTTPLIAARSDGTRFFWDEGGVALRVDGVPTIVDGNTLEGDILKTTRDPEKPFPFNTANATYGIESIPARAVLPPTLQERKGVHLFETNFWNLTRLIRTGFVQVPRDVPAALAELPPVKQGQGRLVHPSEGKGIANRFIPTKEFGHRRHAAELYRLSAPPAQDEMLAGVKSKSRILIVEDDITFMDTLLQALGDAGWKCIETATSLAAAQAKLAATKFDYVILDSVLSPEPREETDGVTILRAQKLDPAALNHGTPILFWSSRESRESYQGMSTSEALRFGSRGVISKNKDDVPLTSITDLMIQEIIRSRQST